MEMSNLPISDKAQVETGLLYLIRFQLLMLQEKGETEAVVKRYRAAVGALIEHLSLVRPSLWFIATFTRGPGFFAGYWWYITVSGGKYQVRIGKTPTELLPRPILALVKGELTHA